MSMAKKGERKQERVRLMHSADGGQTIGFRTAVGRRFFLLPHFLKKGNNSSTPLISLMCVRVDQKKKKEKIRKNSDQSEFLLKRHWRPLHYNDQKNNEGGGVCCHLHFHLLSFSSSSSSSSSPGGLFSGLFFVYCNT
jgi:hypothetical protein